MSPEEEQGEVERINVFVVSAITVDLMLPNFLGPCVRMQLKETVVGTPAHAPESSKHNCLFYRLQKNILEDPADTRESLCAPAGVMLAITAILLYLLRASDEL